MYTYIHTYIDMQLKLAAWADEWWESQAKMMDNLVKKLPQNKHYNAEEFELRQKEVVRRFLVKTHKIW